MKVTLFATCLVDMFQGDVGKATVELLERLGCEIDFPESQICCGQPAYNSGYVEDTKPAMKKMIETFEHAEYVVSPSGSCAYFFKEYPHIFKGDPVWESKAQALADKTYGLTQFIVEVLGVKDVGASLEGTATYHTSCHMTRLLGVKEAPMELLKNVKGLEFTELPGKDKCCGFGGTFSVKMSHISEQMVDEKVQCVEETEADILIGADAGCLINIGGRID
ncbi:(Fe-S)-binding protein [Robertmurraya sp. 2P01SA]